jgi:hypothetical protein
MPGFWQRHPKDPLNDLVDDFLIGSDLDAQQLLKEHEDVLLSDNAVQRMEERIPLLHRQYHMDSRIMEKFERHRAFLEDARGIGVQEAIEKNNREDAQADWICKQFLTLPDDALSFFTKRFRDDLFSLRAIDYLEHLIDTNHKKQGDAWLRRSQARLESLKEMRKRLKGDR